MEELWTLLGLSLAMLVGCYLAGSIPLACTLSEVGALSLSCYPGCFIDLQLVSVGVTGVFPMLCSEYAGFTYKL